MSVRDKIAGFGGAATATTSRPGISGRPNHHHGNGFAASNGRLGANVPASSSNARTFAHDSTPSAGGGGDAAVRKLKVPSVFKNATKPADVPVAAVAGGTAGHLSSSSSAPGKKWGTPAAGASNGTGATSVGGGTHGTGRIGSAPGDGAGGGSASQWKAQDGTGTASRTAKRSGSGDANKPRDILGIAAVMSAGSSSLARSAPAAVDNKPVARTASVGNSSNRNGSSSSSSSSSDRAGRASPTGRSDKPKAGPRKLNLTRISAEKQRAALGLDKNLDEENNDGGTLRPQGGGVSASAAKPANGVGTSFINSSSSSSSSSYSKPAAASSRPAAARVGGGPAARSGGGAAKLPSAGSLRSSGHNLW